MGASWWLRIISRLAIVAVVLSILVVPLALYALASGLSPDIGDNGMGDTFALAAGISTLILAVSGVVLGLILAVLAKRTIADPGEARGGRRTILMAGLAIAGVELSISMVVGGGWSLIIGAIVAFAAGFLAISVTARQRGASAVAAVLAVGLLALGVLPLWGQASQLGVGARRDERVALMPDMSTAVDAAKSAAPGGWSVALVSVRITDFAPTEEIGYLPTGLAAGSLRGIVVVDCAGAASLEAVAQVGDTLAGLGTAPCDGLVHVVPIEVPDVLVRADPPAYVLGIEIAAVDEGSSGAMNRALILVAPADAPDPEDNALRGAFVAAFGTEQPR